MTTATSSSTLTRRSGSRQAGEVVTQQCTTKNNVSNIYNMQSRRLRLRRSTTGMTSTILDKPNEIMVPQSTILTFERIPLRFWQRSTTSSNDGICMKRRQKRISTSTVSSKCSRSSSVPMAVLVSPIRTTTLNNYLFISLTLLIMMMISRQQEDYTAYFCGGRAIAFTTTTSSKWNHRILNVGNRNKQLKNGYEAKKGVGEYFVPVDFRKSQSPSQPQQNQPLDNNTIEHLNAAWREASINLKKENKQVPVSVGDFDGETPLMSAAHHGNNNNNNNEFVEDDPNKYPPTVEIERRTTMTEGREGMLNEKDSSGMDADEDDGGGGFWRSMLGGGTNAIKMPKKNRAGIYQIETEEQHGAFLEANEGKALIVMKFYAPYCRACKALEPKFKAIVSHKRYRNLPIKFAEMGARGSTTQQFFQRLGILALPTMLFYDSNNRLVDNFPCAPSKINVFQKKLTQFLTDHVDPETLKLKTAQAVSVSERGEQQIAGDSEDMMSTTSGMIGYDGQERQASPLLWEADGPRVTRDILVGNEYVTEEHLNYLKNELSFFKDLTDEEFFDMLSKAKLQTYDAGDIIIRQGMPGTTFYVIKSGTAEMYVRSKFDSLLSTSTSNYLGAVVNELGKFDYFGERALTSGQPLAASVRALDKVRCFAFDVNDIPESSILSKERRATADLVDQLSRRYELPDEYEDDAAAAALASSRPEHDMVLDLLVRFKQIRQATKGFEYILTTNPEFGNKSEAIRRRMLVAKLSQLQRDEFRAVFDMADTNRRGRISLLELKQFMSSAGKEQHYDDDELLEIISRANPAVDGSREYITLDDFMGVMAEAEFYYLFKDTFRELDRDNTGYVKVGDLDEMLGGVSELISDDRGKSLIDNEDKDILVDYEQFSIMLLGAGLY